MGIIDQRLLLSNNQTVYSSPILGSTDIVDLQHLRDIGRGEPMFVEFKVTESFAIANGSPTLYTAVVLSDTPGASWYVPPTANIEIVLISGGTNIDAGILVANSISLPVGRQAAALAAGTTWYMPIPTWHPSVGGVSLGLRYFGVMYFQYGYDAGVRDFSAGKMSARIVDMTCLPKQHYPCGYDG